MFLILNVISALEDLFFKIYFLGIFISKFTYYFLDNYVSKRSDKTEHSFSDTRSVKLLNIIYHFESSCTKNKILFP